jgi:hypothetical protein
VIFNQAGWYESVIATIFALGLLKISIALFLLRLGNSKWCSRSLWTLIALVSAYSIFALVSFIVRCLPVAGAWDTFIKSKCYSWEFFLGTALANTSKFGPCLSPVLRQFCLRPHILQHFR